MAELIEKLSRKEKILAEESVYTRIHQKWEPSDTPGHVRPSEKQFTIVIGKHELRVSDREMVRIARDWLEEIDNQHQRMAKGITT